MTCTRIKPMVMGMQTYSFNTPPGSLTDMCIQSPLYDINKNAEMYK